MSRQELVSNILDEKRKYHQGMPNKLIELISIACKGPYYMVDGYDF